MWSWRYDMNSCLRIIENRYPIFGTSHTVGVVHDVAMFGSWAGIWQESSGFEPCYILVWVERQQPDPRRYPTPALFPSLVFAACCCYCFVSQSCVVAWWLPSLPVLLCFLILSTFMMDKKCEFENWHEQSHCYLWRGLCWCNVCTCTLVVNALNCEA